MNKNIYIIGAGGNSKVIIDICNELGYSVLGVYDDNYKNLSTYNYRGVLCIGNIDDIFKLNNDKINICVCIGNIGVRNKLVAMFLKDSKFYFPNLIHPSAYISPTARIGIGNVLYYDSVLNSDVCIGDFNFINTRTIVEHDSQIGNFNNISPNCTICGTCIIGNNNFIGASTTFRNNVTLGTNNLVGCHSNVVKCFGNNNKLYGNPAKKY